MLDKPILVVGLGNPGSEYEKTRHNAGFWFCDALANRSSAAWASNSRFHGHTTKTGHDLLLLKPNTFMNRSGQAVQAICHFHRITPTQIIVVHDELDIPPGELRLKFGGGAGGHNGLKDITEKLGVPDYWRLRIGIGHPGDRNQVVNFVLKPPAKTEQELIEQSIDRALAAWDKVVAGQWNQAATELNIRLKAAG